jgi:tetratricopeptide (TPR) repeat protein
VEYRLISSNTQLHAQLTRGDWEALNTTSATWLLAEPGQPVATFIQNIACLFTNPPAIIRNKRYLESVSSKDWKVVLGWFKDFMDESDRNNPYFQSIAFILQPPSKKKDSIEAALQQHPRNAELLFLQAISLRDRNASINKLNQALEDKPQFPAALYLLGIFSLQLNQVEAAEGYLKQAVEQSPDFLEAHYQLGSLYSLYMPESPDKAKAHLEKVVALDPEGGAGRDAKKVLEGKIQPQFGQRVGGGAGARRGGMSILTIAGISLLTVVLFSGPVANLLNIDNPSIGILAGLFVFVGLYSATRRRKGG